VSESELFRVIRFSACAFLVCAGGCSSIDVQYDADADGAPVEPVAVTPDPAPATPDADPVVEPDLACARITVAAAGDMMLGTDYPENHLPDDDGQSFLAAVTPIFSSADIAFGNLEGVLMDGGEPVKTCKDPSACYLFRSPTRYADHLANAGFTVMSLANNHARDFGEEGRTGSMEALQAAGIRHSGRQGDVATWPNGEVRAALIAFAPFKNSHSMLDIESAQAEVRALAATSDVVIVSFHGGAEGADAGRIPFSSEFYYGEDRGNVVEFSRAMIDAGADLIIGHGPHVPRAMEIYADRLIAYSLGNFATYYGISVAGMKGYAPILVATLDGDGRFISGEIVSAIQQRPAGPQLDPRQRAYERIWELTEQDFGGGDILFQSGGSFFPTTDLLSDCQHITDELQP
jgi:hypothetical protein